MSKGVRSLRPMRIRDSNTAFAVAFGVFMAVLIGGGSILELADDGLTAGEFVGGVLLALALGLFAGVQSYYVNRWLRKRGYGIGEDDE
jgi:hypothetical protein